MWPFTLSGRLPIVALVGRHPANQLIGRRPIPRRALWPPRHAPGRLHGVLIPVSRGCPPAGGRLPTRYSPVRRFPPAASAKASAAGFSLDLHVLGAPPAFILSQDRTLDRIFLKAPLGGPSFRVSLRSASRLRVSRCSFSEPSLFSLSSSVLSEIFGNSHTDLFLVCLVVSSRLRGAHGPRSTSFPRY